MRLVSVAQQAVAVTSHELSVSNELSSVRFG